MLCVLAADYTHWVYLITLDNFSIEASRFESRPDNFVSLKSLDQWL